MKLWNRNFFLLWQGQLVSVLGDALYSIALNFFVLQETGSTAIMGTVMALVTIPRIVLGPISGVIVDRVNRKKIIVIGDIIRGVGLLLVSLAEKHGILEIWMIMLLAAVSGICASFFNPAIESVFPDIVSSKNLVKANSAYQIATTGADILGQSIGGTLYSLLGAPIIFLLNGVSYLFSAFTECYIKVPKIERQCSRFTFREDFKDGISFIFKNEGLIRTIIMSFFINYLFGMIRVSIIPWFVNNEGLGMTKYGILGGFQSIGLMVGMVVLSFVHIQAKDRYKIYVSSLILFIVCIGMGALVNQYNLILILFVVAFAFQFVFNTVLNSTIMIKTPVDKRGKVSATKTTIGMAVSPLGNFVGGILCEYIDARMLILLSAILAIIVVPVLIMKPAVRNFLDGEEDSGIMERNLG